MFTSWAAKLDNSPPFVNTGVVDMGQDLARWYRDLDAGAQMKSSRGSGAVVVVVQDGEEDCCEMGAYCSAT